ncbi:phytanoyl-CoA dioxygenase family protein [Paenibacillus sp. CC-CFT747]|nr:phytanoyl-CoA dioxygenase family protein [Paenibacillus sp. CC-CFT747]
MSQMVTQDLLKQEQIDFYRKNGFVQVNDVLTSEELAELREFMDEVMGADQGMSLQTDQQGGAYYRVLNQRVNTWRDHAGMARYTTHSRFAEMARLLTGASGIRLFHDHALLKMPGDSKPTPWHQDSTYWPMNEDGALSIWIALDDVDENNGCMMFVPESRRAGKLNPISLSDPQDLFQYAEGTGHDQSQSVICRMKAGSATFHDGLTFHFAHANVTDKPRRALAIIFMPDGITYSGKSHPVTNGQPLEKDQPIRGGLFPLLARGV